MKSHIALYIKTKSTKQMQLVTVKPQIGFLHTGIMVMHADEHEHFEAQTDLLSQYYFVHNLIRV